MKGEDEPSGRASASGGEQTDLGLGADRLCVLSLTEQGEALAAVEPLAGIMAL